MRNWDNYFMDIADLVKTRATCMRRQVGAIIVKDNRILTTGYNGAPSGITECIRLKKCKRQELNIPSGQRHEICKGVHAEQNAIIQAAYSGVSVKGSTMYVTDMPCNICAKMIINSGISKVIYKSDYPDKESLSLLKEGGVRIVSLENAIREIVSYINKECSK